MESLLRGTRARRASLVRRSRKFWPARDREAMPLDSRYEFLLVLMFLGVAFLLFPDMVVACARAPKPTVLQAYNDSDVVVIARAISVEKLSDESQKPMIGTLVTSTTMEVEKVYKGNLRVGDTMVFWPRQRHTLHLGLL